MSQTTHSFSTHYLSLTNVLEVKVKIAPAFDPATTKEYPEHKEFKAIWDTGASHSVITKKVADECNLKPIGVQEVHGVHSSELSNAYLVNIVLPNGVPFIGFRVTEARLTPGSDALIGMDIINRGDFALTHKDGKTLMSFRVPSVGYIDFVEQKAAGLSIGRNQKCPCGSGKKYKKCCG